MGRRLRARAPYLLAGLANGEGWPGGLSAGRHMDLKKYVPRAQAEALIAAAEERADTNEEAVKILQDEVTTEAAARAVAESKIAAAEASAKDANARADRAQKDCEEAERVAAKERDLRGKAELAEAAVRADLKIAQAAIAHEKEECAEAERQLRDTKAELVKVEKALRDAEVRAATAEKLRAAAEARAARPAAASAPVKPQSAAVYDIEIHRSGDGLMRALRLTPKRSN